MRKSAPKGRFFQHGELPLVILALLEREPMHAYDVLGRIATLFGDRYNPSPGTVYPALNALAAEGLIRGRADGRRTVYELGAKGRATLVQRRTKLIAFERRLGIDLGAGASLDAELEHFAARVRRLAPRAGRDAVRAVLADAESMLARRAQDGGRHGPQLT